MLNVTRPNLFPKFQRHESHKNGQPKAIVRDYEYHHKPTESNDNQFYGYVHYQLGCTHFNGNGTEINYEKAWYHFYQAHEVFDNREALYFMTIEIESINDPETPLLLKKINMFITVISELDGEQLHQLGSVFYNKIHSDNPHNNFINQTNEFAFDFLQKSLEKENPKLKKLIGDMYNFGYGVEADHEKSLQYHIDWANNQDGQANFRTGQEYYNAEENHTIALMYIVKAANQKNDSAQRYLHDVIPSRQNTTYIKKEDEIHKAIADLQSDSENLDVGLMYYYGIGNIKRNCLAGLIYLQQSTNQANHVARRILGDVYYFGNGIDKSQEKGNALHKLSSSQLDWMDYFRIDECYYIGSKHFKKNHNIAYIYFTESVKKGNHEARRYLGDIYFSGDVVEVDKEKALELHENYANALSEANLIIIGPTYYDKQWYSIAAIYLKKTTQTDPTVCRYLGNMYYYGKGVELNQEKALKLHGLSAGLSTKAKNYNIGLDYFNGSGQTNKCVDIGLIYINEAINQGYSTAERFIGDKYYYGCDSLQKNQEKALELHRASANRNDAYDNFKWGKNYYEGSNGVLKDSTTGFIYLNKSALDQHHSDALQYLGDLYYYGDGDGIEKDQEKALELYKVSADRNDAYDNFKWGKDYYEGSNGLLKDTTIGLIYLNKSALDQHYSDALQYLGGLYYYGNGDGIEKDQEKALELHKLLADRNYAYDNFEWGKDYYEGSNGLLKDTTIGLIYLNKSALDQHYSEALQYLGGLYYYGDGDGIEKDQEKALELHKFLADRNDAYDNFKWGRDYYEGSNGLLKDTTIGLIYLNKSALDQHDSKALQYLGGLYYYGDGDGIEKDQEKALELHKLLADQNNAKDNFKWGKNYYEGSNGVLKDSATGFIYLSKAYNQKPQYFKYELDDIYYFGEEYEYDPKKALDLIIALEINI
ncbi:HCP-like protein [Backusella circina FSU 941]|nr:HCP-like protein [Backusella circina FSU 941]